MEKIKLSCGCTIEKDGKRIFAITNRQNQRIRVGQIITTKGGGNFIPGAKGKVIKIFEPLTRGSTHDVIRVRFIRDGGLNFSDLKFKDIEFVKIEKKGD